jgi:glycolate oxidase FAD binding subunit
MITDEIKLALPEIHMETGAKVDPLLGNNGDLTVLPKTEKEMVSLLQFAYQHGKTVTIMGGSTKRGFGGVLDSTDFLLSLEDYHGVVEHSVGDMTVTVRSGTKFAELQDFLKKHRQMIPLDPPVPGEATIGGVISANESGPKRLGYGSARDAVIGLKMVYPDGTVIRTGGKTVKNVAGYDMNKLFIGAMGTLGVISEITLKLRPLPKNESLVFLFFPDGNLNEIRNIAVRLLDSILEPTSLELLNPTLAEKLIGIRFYTLAISFEDVEASVRYQVDFVESLHSSTTVLEQEQAQEFWKRFLGLQSYSASLKIGVKNLDVLAIIRECTLLQDSHQIEIEAHGGLGHGLCKVFLTGGMEDVLSAILQLRSLAEKLGGYAVVTHLPFEGRKKIEVWGGKPAHFFLLEGIKAKIDSKCLLNPKRFVGGI